MRISYWSSDVCSSDLDVHPAAIGVRGLFHDESDGAGNVFRLKRRQELVPTGLAVRFHILEYLGTGCAGRNKSDLYSRTGQFDPERVREHLQREFQPAINANAGRRDIGADAGYVDDLAASCRFHRPRAQVATSHD